MRQQRRKNRPTPTEIVGVQPQLLVPGNITLSGTDKLVIDFPQSVWIDGRPKWFVNEIESVLWTQINATQVEVDFGVPVPVGAWFSIPAWSRNIRGLHGEWVSATGRTVNPAPPAPSSLVWPIFFQISGMSNEVIVQFSEAMDPPGPGAAMLLNGVTAPDSWTPSMVPTEWVASFAGGVSAGNTMQVAQGASDWTAVSGAALTPGLWVLP